MFAIIFCLQNAQVEKVNSAFPNSLIIISALIHDGFYTLDRLHTFVSRAGKENKDCKTFCLHPENAASSCRSDVDANPLSLFVFF